MLSQSTLERVYVLRGGGEVLVAPPVVGQAIPVLETLGAVRDDDDWRLLWDLLSAWLPAAVIEDLKDCSRAGFARRLTGLLMAGHDAPKKHQVQSGAQGEDDETPATWRYLLSSYCATYGGAEPWQVWERVPFPFFLEMCEEAVGERARRTLSDALAASIPHSGKSGQKTLRSLQKQATGRPPKGSLEDLVEPTAGPTPVQAKQEERATEDEIARLFWRGKQ